jgi:hypothetical protein
MKASGGLLPDATKTNHEARRTTAAFFFEGALLFLLTVHKLS